MGRKGVEGPKGGRGEEGMERREGVEVRSRGGWQEERREGRRGGRQEGQSDGRIDGRSDGRSDVRVELHSQESGYHSEGERREQYRLEDFSLLTTIGTGQHSGIMQSVKNH